jgi:aminopeptidase-like protein
MDISATATLDTADGGARMHGLIAELFPICRSITGDGVRATLRRLQAEAPITILEVPSGEPAFDWVVPPEWNIRDAYIADMAGRRVVDIRRHSLHVLSYSTAVRRRMSLAELRPHLHTLPEQPELIPYRTSYYKEAWGFCLSHSALQSMPEGEYEVVIDSTLQAGHLSYGELFLPGATQDEVLISCHICHPSLANDNLAGVAVAMELARALRGIETRYGYRFVFIPGTIGAITWLARNEAHTERIKAGLVLTCVGDAAPITYKRSRRGDTAMDRAFAHVLRQREGGRVIDFYPYGYDERQYNSPGFNLPVGCLMRSQHGQFPEYHTSADNLEFVRPEALADTLHTILAALRVLEQDGVYLNTNPKCEPQLGKRGLYGALGGTDIQRSQLAMLWVLNLSDGSHSLLSIAERAAMPFDLIAAAAARLREAGLLVQNH